MDDLLTVTSLNKSRRSKTKTINVIDYDTTIGNDQTAINVVTDLRDQIESREAEVVRLREALERDNEVDMSKIPDELKKLQKAFDQVQLICKERMAPYEAKFNKNASNYEAKQYYMETMDNIAKERFGFLSKMNNKADDTTARLEDPPVKPVDETPIFPLSHEASKLESELASFHRNTVLESYMEKQFKKLNDDIQRNLKDADFDEKKEERRVENAKQDIAVRCSRPKPVFKIDQEWVDSHKTLNKNVLFLTEVNNSIRLFNEESQKLSTQNRQLNDKLANLREEFLSLQRYLPGQDGTFSDKDQIERSNLTKKAMENDKLVFMFNIAKNKYRIEKSRLDSILEKVKVLPNAIKEEQEKLQKVKEQRREADIDLDNAHAARADLMSQQRFLEDQRDLMKERITEQREKLRSTLERTKKLKLILKKQLMIIQLNDELYNLKKMNLERVAGTVSNLLKINNEIDDFKE